MSKAQRAGSKEPRATRAWSDAIRHLAGKSIFPEGLAWFLEGSWRRLVLSPEKLRARLPLAPQSVVCEIGIGGGYYGRALAPFVGRFIGIDIQLGMLLRVANHVDGRGLLLVQADATRMPIGSGTIDIVIAVTVMGEVPSASETVAEVARVLRPGGTLSVSEHFPDPDYVPFGTLRTLCENQGLRFEKKDGMRWSYTATFVK